MVIKWDNALKVPHILSRSEHAASFSFYCFSLLQLGILNSSGKPRSQLRSHFYNVSDRLLPCFDLESPVTGHSRPSGTGRASSICGNKGFVPIGSSHLSVLLYELRQQNLIFRAQSSTSSFSQSSGDDTRRCLHFFMCQWPMDTVCRDRNKHRTAEPVPLCAKQSSWHLVVAHCLPGCVLARILWGKFYYLHFVFKKLRKVKNVSFCLFINKIIGYIGRYLYI